jgi:hypothetical protein
LELWVTSDYAAASGFDAYLLCHQFCFNLRTKCVIDEFNQVCLQVLNIWIVFPQGQVTAISTLFMSKLAILGADNKDNQRAPFHILYP